MPEISVLNTKESDPRLLLLSTADNVFVVRGAIDSGEIMLVEGQEVACPARLGIGHKVARRSIAAGERVIKYGAPIGTAISDIALGDHVHLHNLKSSYTATYSLEKARTAHDRLAGEAK